MEVSGEEYGILKLEMKDLSSLFLLEVSEGLWSFTTDELDEQREMFARVLNYYVERNEGSNIASPLPFQRVLCFHSENWNRVIYLEKKENNDHLVFFVDYGYSEVVNSTKCPFRKIEPEFWNNKPALVIFTPECYEITDDQMEKLHLSDHRMKMENVKKVTHWNWPIEVITGSLLSSRTKESGPIERPLSISEILRPKLPPQRVTFEKEFRGEITSKTDEQKGFWFLREEDQGVLDEINEAMSKSISTLKQPTGPPKIGDLLLSKFEKQYFRSRVVDIDSTVPQVLFVDFGNTDDLIDKYYVLPETLLKFPPLALRTYIVGCDDAVVAELCEGDEITLTYKRELASKNGYFGAIYPTSSAQPTPSKIVDPEECEFPTEPGPLPVQNESASSWPTNTSLESAQRLYPQHEETINSSDEKEGEHVITEESPLKIVNFAPIEKKNLDESIESTLEGKREEHLRMIKNSIPRRLDDPLNMINPFELVVMSKNEVKEHTYIEGYLKTDSETLRRMSDEISPTESIVEPIIGDIVVVHSKVFEARPVRGQIKGFQLGSSDQTVSVHLIDYGMTELHPCSRVYKYRPLVDREYQYAFAVKAVVRSDFKFGLMDSLTVRKSSVVLPCDSIDLPLLIPEAPLIEVPSRETCHDLPSPLELQIDLTVDDAAVAQKEQDSTQISTCTVNGRKIVLTSVFKCGKIYECMFLNVRVMAIPNSEKFNDSGKRDYVITLCIKQDWIDFNNLVKDAMNSSVNVPLHEDNIKKGMNVIIKDNSYPTVPDAGWRRGRVDFVPGDKPRYLGRVLPPGRFLVRELDTEKCLVIASSRLFPIPENLESIDCSLPKKVVLRTKCIDNYSAGSVYPVKILRRRKDDLYICEVQEEKLVVDYDYEFETKEAEMKHAFKERNQEAFQKAFTGIGKIASEVFKVSPVQVEERFSG